NTSSTPKCLFALLAVRLTNPRYFAQKLTQNFFPGRKWFDCAECHQEQETHALQKAQEMVFACKKCKKCFRKDAAEFEENDEYCPHCDNHFVLEAITPKAELKVEGDDARMDSRMLKDDRVRADQEKSIFTFRDISDRLG
ncbi:hypothetical protein N7490_005915, partial [Penicillium lividum]